MPLRRQGEGGAAGGQGPTACRLPPGACQGERGRAGAYGLRPAAGWRLPLPAWPPAPCAWRLRPDRRAEGGLCRRPSRGIAGLRWRVAPWRLADAWGLGRWGLGAGADARGGVRLARASRTGEAASGLGRRAGAHDKLSPPPRCWAGPVRKS